MTVPIPTAMPAMPPMPAAQPIGGPTAVASPGVEFGQKISPSEVDPAGTVGKSLKVEATDGKDLFAAKADIAAEIERMRAGLDPSDPRTQVWKLMSLQNRAQDVHFRVELVSKLVDQFAGGVKQLSQTQA